MRPKSLIYNWDSVPIVFDIPIMVKIIGNEWRFRRDSIQKWIDDQETMRKYA